MNGVGSGDSSCTSVPKIMASYPPPPPLRIYIAPAVCQPYCDLEAGDNQSLKFKLRDWESNPDLLLRKRLSQERNHGRVPLAGSIRLILLIRAMERDVPADRIGSSGTSQNGDPNRSNMADALSNVLTTCFYMNYGRCIELCCQNDAICCESDIILLKSTSLLRFPSLFSKYWYSGLSAVRMCSLYFMVETDWFFILFSRIGS